MTNFKLFLILMLCAEMLCWNKKLSECAGDAILECAVRTGRRLPRQSLWRGSVGKGVKRLAKTPAPCRLLQQKSKSFDLLFRRPLIFDHFRHFFTSHISLSFFSLHFFSNFTPRLKKTKKRCTKVHLLKSL